LRNELCSQVSGLKLGTELRFESSHPVSIAGVCSRTFGDAFTATRSLQTTDVPGGDSHPEKSSGEPLVEFSSSSQGSLSPDIMVDLGLSWILSCGSAGTDGAITQISD
jgi:hypothetical protein